ncbi:hypothetical protein C8R45DRAFT_1154959 [Mycena sanguinolenta]|nr:hypothetical protein C8R45DRAFT_1154959 [Mycena sanguinolenta]
MPFTHRFATLTLCLLLATTAIFASRECAVCPEEVKESEKQIYRLELREIQPDNVVCGYSPVSPTKKRNGWAYCTYDDTGKKIQSNLTKCPPHVDTTTNCTEF